MQSEFFHMVKKCCSGLGGEIMEEVVFTCCTDDPVIIKEKVFVH